MNKVTALCRTTTALFFVQVRALRADFRGLFFIFAFPLTLIFVVGLVFYKGQAGASLMFAGLVSMSLLSINISLTAFQIVDWRNSVLFSRMKVADIRFYHLFLAFFSFYALMSVMSWIWAFTGACVVMAIKGHAGQVQNVVRHLRWDWQLLALLAGLLCSLPIGITLGFGLRSVESVQFAGSLIITLLLCLSGVMFPIGYITQHSNVMKYLSYLFYFRYIVNLNQVAWNHGDVPSPTSPFNDGYHIWQLLVPIAVFFLSFWTMAALFVVRSYRRV